MKPIVALLAALSLFIVARTVWADPPTISFISPSAVAPGAETDVTLHGAGLASPTGIWTGFPAVTSLTPGLAANGTKADEVTYHFRVPPEVGVGIWGMRVATGSGVSAMRLVMTDDLPSVADAGNNKSIATAQPVSLPAAIDGACEAEQVDCYRFTAAAGQRISVEVVARRLGSALDPVIRLLDAAGKELAYSDDEPGLGPDGRFAYRVPAAGDYFVEIRDIRYQGGPTHRYRLRLGDFPLATACYPLAAAVNTTPKLELVGPGVQTAIAPLASIPAAGVGALLRLSAKQPDGRGSSAVTLLGSNLLEQTEIEGNNTPETATPCTIPGAING